MIRILGVRTKIICFKNISKFFDNGSIFTLFIVQIRTQTIEQSLNYRVTTLLIIEFFQEQQQPQVINIRAHDQMLRMNIH